MQYQLDNILESYHVLCMCTKKSAPTDVEAHTVNVVRNRMSVEAGRISVRAETLVFVCLFALLSYLKL